MKIGIDIDGVLTKQVNFFNELTRLFRKEGHKVYIITGLGKEVAEERLKDYLVGEHDGIHSTDNYSTFEKSLIPTGISNEIIVGILKKRMCAELGISAMFDNRTDIQKELCDSVGKCAYLKVIDPIF